MKNLSIFPKRNRPLLFALVATGTICFASMLPFALLWKHTEEHIDSDLRQSLGQIAASAALHVDADLHMTFHSVEQESSSEYIEQINRLRKFKSVHPRIAYLYTFILHDGKPHFILDAAPPGDADNDGVDDHSYIMDEYLDPTPVLMESLEKEIPLVEKDFWTDAWGTFISAFHPLYSSSGEFAGVVGVDLSIEEVAAMHSKLKQEAILPFVLLLVCAFGVGCFVFILSTYLSKQEQEAIDSRRVLTEERVKVQKLESIGYLAGGIAHDFNNILTAVLGNLTLYAKENGPALSDEERKEIIHEAVDAAKSAKQLTSQLLIFAKGGEPVKKVIDLGQLAVKSARFTLRGSACTLASRWIASDLWPAEADENQVAQVIQNLVINAKQAMKSGGTVGLEVKNTLLEKINPFDLDAGPYTMIRISDHGPGIDPSIRENIFDPYFTTKEEGSGLGLSTSFSIIQKHGGTIQLSSSSEEGSTFSILIPAAPGRSTESALLPPEEKIVESPTHVLIMDDDPIILSTAERILKSEGHRVGIAADGEEALRYLERVQAEGDPVQISILDLTVAEGMGGKDAAHAMQEQFPECALIVSSGYSEDEVMANYRRFGFSQILKKPYASDELLAVIQRARVLREC